MNWRWQLAQLTRRARSLTPAIDGSSRDARMTMIAITTSNSISENARRKVGGIRGDPLAVNPFPNIRQLHSSRGIKVPLSGISELKPYDLSEHCQCRRQQD